MQLENEARAIGDILRAAIRLEREVEAPRVPSERPRHDLGDEIAALDDHWVFRKR